MTTETGTIERDGARLAYERRGSSGVPIVLIHGFGSDRSSWDGWWDQIAPHRAVLRYDMRGFGASTNDSDIAFTHGDDLAALLDALNIDQCDLAGVSMGGSVAINFALDRPARVRALALVSPMLVAWTWSEEWRSAWRTITRLARQGDMAAARRRWFEHPLFASTRKSPACAALKDAIDRFSGRQWVSDPHRPLPPDLGRLHTLLVPTLLLSGEMDLPDFRLMARAIEGTAPNVSHRHWPTLGHLIQMEEPEETAQAALAFFDRSIGQLPRSH